jgi:hypothetical protein
MRLMKGATRSAVVKEIVGGVEIQVAAGGGDFAKVAPALDDPSWVGRQMVTVYGAAPLFRAIVVLLGLLLGAASVPGLLVRPADSGGAILAALLSFVLLVVVLFWGAVRISGKGALSAALLAGVVRVAGLFLAVGEFAPIQTTLPGEVGLYLLSTVLMLVVVAMPVLVTRLRARDAAP